MKIEINIPDRDDSHSQKYQEIIVSLIGSGALDLHNGKAVLHFAQGVFQGVQLDYWAVKRNRDGEKSLRSHAKHKEEELVKVGRFSG